MEQTFHDLSCVGVGLSLTEEQYRQQISHDYSPLIEPNSTAEGSYAERLRRAEALLSAESDALKSCRDCFPEQSLAWNVAASLEAVLHDALRNNASRLLTKTNTFQSMTVSIYDSLMRRCVV